MFKTSNIFKALLGLALLLFVSCSKQAETGKGSVTKLPADARAAFQHEQDFTILKKASEIPPAALETIRHSQRDTEFKMADAGGRFQETDDVTDERLPWRQLQFAALSKDFLLIHHAQGGIGLGYYFVLLKRSGDNFSVVWVAAGPQCSNFQDFISNLDSGKIDDHFDYLY